LILHLVASHHGRARPGFNARAFDNQHPLARNEQASLESELRFDRLQRRYGWWGLAYLEALMKCADVMGSKEADK
jgi:CRISPR-associated endonuclease/helicase Cas3